MTYRLTIDVHQNHTPGQSVGCKGVARFFHQVDAVNIESRILVHVLQAGTMAGERHLLGRSLKWGWRQQSSSAEEKSAGWSRHPLLTLAFENLRWNLDLRIASLTTLVEFLQDGKQQAKVLPMLHLWFVGPRRSFIVLEIQARHEILEQTRIFELGSVELVLWRLEDCNQLFYDPCRSKTCHR